MLVIWRRRAPKPARKDLHRIDFYSGRKYFGVYALESSAEPRIEVITTAAIEICTLNEYSDPQDDPRNVELYSPGLAARSQPLQIEESQPLL